MCSIVALLELRSDPAAMRARSLDMSRRLRHRGPDWSGVFACERAVLAHERLAIVDVEHGAQPLLSGDGALVLAVNGEIYNHLELREQLRSPYAFSTASDCEVLIPLFRELGSRMLQRLRGMFAFVLYDRVNDRYFIARDHMGIIPLYWGRDAAGTLHVASEMKALVPFCTTVAIFPPGHYVDSAQSAEPVAWYQRDWFGYDAVAGQPADTASLRTALEDAVRSHMMCDVPYGVLLSGGLDSSIVAATAARFAPRRIEDGGATGAWWPRLHSFAVGLAGSPDLAAAREVADHIGTVHHEFRYTIDEGIDALRDVIYHIETYDVTSIRASTPMFLMARRIRAMGIKMVLSGEGADEIFGGYLYFHKAPDPRAFHEELVRKLQALHLYDNLRANKSMAAWGVEARVPFLDVRFLDTAMRIDASHKMVSAGGQEKQILRDAFRDVLPDRVYRRQKEQFSDGVGYGWIDSLKAHAARLVSDSDLAQAAERFPYNPPETAEAYLYRSIFAELFPLDAAAQTVPGGKSVACSTPAAIAWDAAFAAMADPSGRAVSVHSDPLRAGRA